MLLRPRRDSVDKTMLAQRANSRVIPTEMVWNTAIGERSKFEVDGRKLKTATPFVTGVPINLGKVLLTEEFDEGLMVLRRLLRWEMVDMTYVSVYKTTAGARRYDGKPLVDAPRFEDLPVQVGGRVRKARALRRV